MIDYDGYELFEQDGVGKSITILGDGVSFTNSDIDSENFELNESLCSQNTLKIGVCESASIKFRIGYGTDSLVGKVLTVYMKLAGREDSLPIGVYTVTSDELSADKRYRNITAYDSLNTILKRSVSSWYNTIFPDMQTSVTVKDFRDSFFAYFGIEQEDITLINDSAVLQKTIETDQLLGKDIIESICEMNGCFGHITRTGTFKYVYLDELDAETAIEIGDNKSYKDIKYEDFVTEPLTKLQIRQEENDIGVIVGSGTNDYVIEGNPLLYGMSVETLMPIANNILSKLELLSYRPCTIDLRGNPCIEVGDGIKAVTSYTTVMSYVLQRKLKGVQALADTFTATGTKVYHNNSNSIHSQIVQLRGKSNTLERTIDETRSELVDLDSETRSLIVQTADGLQVQINELYSEIDGDINLYYVTETPTLLNYPAWDFTYNIPCDNTVQLRDDLAFEYTEEYYRKNLRSVAYDETNNLTYRFIKANGVWYWDEVTNTETSLILSRLSTLEATTEGIQTEVSQISLDLDDNYYTKSETNTKITQSATDITTSVSATYATKTTTNQISAQVQLKVDRESLASEISASAGTITLNSNRLVINSDNFALAADGKITATNANVSGTITTSNITASGGSIGNFTLDTALHSGMTSLADTSHNGVYVGSDGIALGQGKFKVTNAGALTASNANISGTITTSNITATGGSIGNFTLDTALKNGMTSLSDTSHNGVYLGSDGIALGGGAFKVTNAGALTASNASISGTISTSNLTATGGTIGGFNIGSASMSNGMTSLTDTIHNGVWIGTNGIALGAGAFKVTSAGALTASNANISGTITTSNITATGGSIGNFTLDTALRSGLTSFSDTSHDGVYLGSDGIALGKGKFKVTNGGVLTATGANISGALTATSLTLGSNVKISAGTNISGLADVATSGEYADLLDTPDLDIYVSKDGVIGTQPAEGSTGFVVSSTGLLRASNAVIYGTIYASAGKFAGTVTTGNITATGGSIGNFTLDTALKSGMTSLSDTTHNGVYLGSDGIALGKGAFKITNAGVLTATNANITGVVNATSGSFSGTVTTSNITATGGTVGGFTIDSTSIRSAALTSNASGSVGLSTANFTRTINGTSRSSLRFAIGSNFGVTNTGALYAGGANISGTITATGGSIGGFQIGTNQLLYRVSNTNYNVIRGFEDGSIHHVDIGSTSEYLGIYGNPIYLQSQSGTAITMTNGIELVALSGTVYVGTGASQAVEIKGRSVTWKTARDAVSDNDYVLCEV